MVVRFNVVDLGEDSVILKVLDDSSESLDDIIFGSFALTVDMMVSWTRMPLISFYRGADSYIGILFIEIAHFFSLRHSLLGYHNLVISCCFL